MKAIVFDRFGPPEEVLQVRDVPQPDEAQVRLALSGNLCRCTGYQHIVDAVLLCAQRAAGATSTAPASERAPEPSR